MKKNRFFDKKQHIKEKEVLHEKLEKRKTREKNELIFLFQLRNKNETLQLLLAKKRTHEYEIISNVTIKIYGSKPSLNFGFLSGGRIGKGDSERLHKVFYKEDQPLAYHAAVHDAFGYLIQYHEVGPGYNYLNTRWTFFRKESPLACQTAGVKFWRKVLKRNPVEKEF